jgi:hypothetical protein
VTHNVADSPRILREWAAAPSAPTPASSSCTASTTASSRSSRGVERLLPLRPDPPSWTDFPAILACGLAARS